MDKIPDDLKEKLNHLASYLDELDYWLAHPLEPDKARGTQRILERMFQLIVECTADAGDIWLDSKAFPAGESVRGVFERLREHSIIDDERTIRCAEYVSLRNRIVHDYERVSATLLQNRAPGLLSDCRFICRQLLEL